MQRCSAFIFVVPILFMAAFAQKGQSQDNNKAAALEMKDSRIAKDQYGDPLPPGALARLGTIRLHAVGAKVALSADGKTIITASLGGKIKYWDTATGILGAQRQLPIQSTSSTFLSPDGKILATGKYEADSAIDIWEITAEKRLHRLELPPKQDYFRVIFSPDAKRLAVAGDKSGIIRLWKMESGTHQDLIGNGSQAPGIMFSPDGKLLAAANVDGVICWDCAQGLQLWRSNVAAQRLAFIPDGKVLIAALGHRGVNPWHSLDTGTGKPTTGFKFPGDIAIEDLAIAPDGSTLIFAQSWPLVAADSRVRLWDLRSGKLLHTLPTPGEFGPFLPDGKSFLTNDGTLQRWELATGKPLFPNVEPLGHRAGIHKIVYSRDGHLLASSADDGTVRLWDIKTTKTLHILRTPKGVNHLAFTSDGKYLVLGENDAELSVWDTLTGKEVRRIPLYDKLRDVRKQYVHSLHLTPDGRTAIVLTVDPLRSTTLKRSGTLTRWNLEKGDQLTYAKVYNIDSVSNAFSPDGQLLASQGQLFDTTTGKNTVKLTVEVGFASHFAFSLDGRLVAGLFTGLYLDDKILRTKVDGVGIWDAASGRKVGHLPSGDMGRLAFTPDGRYLAGADADGIRLWELATGAMVAQIKAFEQEQGSYGRSFPWCMAMAPNSHSMATGNPDGTILIWGLMPTIRAPKNGNDLSSLWTDLASPDASKAYAAASQLTDIPEPALLLLKKHLRPIIPATREQTRPLLDDLDSEDFRKRDTAANQLRELGERAQGSLHEALKAGPSLEKRRRIEILLKHLEAKPSGETLRELRAVAILERIGTLDAQKQLKELGDGDSQARLTREAKSSLGRLDQRVR